MFERLKQIPDLVEMPIIGIIRNMQLSDVQAMLPVYYQAGLRVIEVTMNTPDAERIIDYSQKHFGNRLTIGAGTVCTSDHLEAAVGAGARFIVTPIVAEEVIGKCLALGLPTFAGAFTPTEVHRAWSLGSSAVKIFPATAVGPQYVRDLLAPLNEIAMIPTGGIDVRNIGSFLKAGAIAVGIGSKLFNQAMISGKTWNGLLEHFVTYVRAAASAKEADVQQILI